MLAYLSYTLHARRSKPSKALSKTRAILNYRSHGGRELDGEVFRIFHSQFKRRCMCTIPVNYDAQHTCFRVRGWGVGVRGWGLEVRVGVRVTTQQLIAYNG
jgi:hypothetical protein